MKYENQRPDLADQVKALVQSANSTKTVPHGVKTVQPGEGLQLLSSEGAEIFWDWETANDYETRIQEGRAAIEQARADLDKAEQDLAAGVVRLEENQAILDALGPRVDAAQSTAAQVSRDLTAVDTRLTSTSKDLTALQGTVGDVQAKAADALAKAGAAQVSADGKTTITRATSPASQPGKSVGDTHFTMSSMGGGGVVTRQQRWDGKTWQDESLSHQVLASLDLGKATVGELDGGRIRAGTVTADRLSVGPSENSIADAGFVSLTISANRATRSDGTWNRARAAADATNYYQRVNYTGTARWHFYPLAGTTYDMTGMIPTSGDTPWRFRADVNSGGGTSQFGVYYINRDGTSAQVLIGVQSQGSNVRRTISADWTTPSTVMGIQPYIQFENGDVARTSTVYGGALARPKIGTVLIEDGAVTGDKVNAQSVAAKVGQFVKVQAANVEVTGELAARVVNSMDTTTKNLVVTESAVLQHTTLLGTTVADQLNVRKLIRGRDAILDGTLDVAQLNVTGEMSAQVARFMDAEARKLIVTEDAILNRATVVEGLVTSELISKKADIGYLAAQMITSGLLQTSTAANRGVKVDNNGIRAWDDAGRQTVNLNGKANYITGTFATAEKEQRVEIKSGGSVAAADFYGSGNTVDHLGVWHQADQGNATASRIISQNGLTRIRENPGMIMWPLRGDFGFTGRWARNTDTVKMFSLVNYSGLPGGAWMDLKFTYTTPFPTLYSELIPVMSVESRSGAECTINTRTNDADSISFRVVNKSANPTDVLYVRGFTFNFNTVTYSTTY